MKRSVRGTTALLCAGLVLSACASDPGAKSSASPVGSIVNEPSARKDVAMTRCSGDSGGWSAGGKVSNPQKSEADYTLVISFTDKHSTVLARATTHVKVAAGGSQDWKVDARFKAPDGVVCVLRGVDRA